MWRNANNWGISVKNMQKYFTSSCNFSICLKLYQNKKLQRRWGWLNIWKTNQSRDFPGSSGKESALQCRGRRFDPWSVNYDPTRCGATRPARHNYWAHEPQLESLQAASYRAHAPWSLCATTREEPTRQNERSRMPQWRSHMPQLRPDAAIKINK